MKTDKLNTIFVLSKNRPTNFTSEYLLSINYPYWYIVIEDDEKYKKEYYRNYGSERIIEFHKKDYIDYDTYDDYGDSVPYGVVPVRNFILDLGKSLKLKRLWEFDDDVKYVTFLHKYNKKSRVMFGSQLYELLDILSTLADETGMEGISLKDGIYLKYNKNYTGKLKYKFNCICVNIPVDTKYKYNNRALDDINRGMRIIRDGKRCAEVQFAVAQTKHLDIGGREDEKENYTMDAFFMNSLKDAPVQDVQIKEGNGELFVSHKYYTASMVPKILRVDK